MKVLRAPILCGPYAQGLYKLGARKNFVIFFFSIKMITRKVEVKTESTEPELQHPV